MSRNYSQVDTLPGVSTENKPSSKVSSTDRSHPSHTNTPANTSTQNTKGDMSHSTANGSTEISVRTNASQGTELAPTSEQLAQRTRLMEAVINEQAVPDEPDEDQYACLWLDCDEVFDELGLLKRHVDQHRAYSCGWDNCSEQLATHGELSMHMAAHHRYDCKWEGCGQVFTSMKRFRSHLSAHDGNTCAWENCGANLTSRSQRLEHAKAHESYVCFWGGCKQSHKSLIDLRVHLQSHVEYSCAWESCGENFVSHIAFSMHMDTHQSVLYSHKNKRGAFKCGWEDCRKECRSQSKSSSEAFMVHVLNHTAYLCEWEGCKQVIKTESALISHLAEHANAIQCGDDGENTGTSSSTSRKICKWLGPCSKYSGVASEYHTNVESHRMLICRWENCGRRFSSPSELKKHMYEHCTQLGTTASSRQSTSPSYSRYVCSIGSCGQIFTCEEHLMQHMVEHKKFVCPYEGCKERYFSEDAVKSHVRSHDRTSVPKYTSYRKYKCTLSGCPEKFALREALNAHILHKHSGGEAQGGHLFCRWEDCAAVFSSEAELQDHQKSHRKRRITTQSSRGGHDTAERSFSDVPESRFFPGKSRYLSAQCSNDAAIANFGSYDQQGVSALQIRPFSSMPPMTSRYPNGPYDSFSRSAPATTRGNLQRDHSFEVTSRQNHVASTCGWNGCAQSFDSLENYHKHTARMHAGIYLCARNGCGAQLSGAEAFSRHEASHTSKNDDVGAIGTAIFWSSGAENSVPQRSPKTVAYQQQGSSSQSQPSSAKRINIKTTAPRVRRGSTAHSRQLLGSTRSHTGSVQGAPYDAPAPWRDSRRQLGQEWYPRELGSARQTTSFIDFEIARAPDHAENPRKSVGDGPQALIPLKRDGLGTPNTTGIGHRVGDRTSSERRSSFACAVKGCRETFGTVAEMNAHLRRHGHVEWHRSSSTPVSSDAFRCHVCAMTLNSSRELDRHMDMHRQWDN
ncbi:hypothetical protein SARC_01922 [Sphaeroforma arctica JP610]|uniref:C2H2-type domain-containing protein n=1 Tax=Sphaeroforma arctica JP610 TaxID=667725 RepID=A0A0L0GAA5_9EUKA|nr:hypothetical protein SARC_01922 [Sphaeroforma arctica JP610]KNC85930.1 hypothetical protein SARC_01922 [Sphaeroforma arctica JP610]|eukprot:XP_014159832.1 hypothetical protein SARC_01922 [Sphaeroforma arctica JP610]